MLRQELKKLISNAVHSDDVRELQAGLGKIAMRWIMVDHEGICHGHGC